MKVIKTAVATVAFSSLAFCAAANAGSLEPQGWTAGLALGAALPQGVYFIDNMSWGGWRGVDDSKSNLFINVPLGVWSTPWTVFGGRVEVMGTVPEIAGGVPYKAALPGYSGRDYDEIYNPAGFVGVAWDLGRGFGLSAFIGGWAPVDNDLKNFGFDSWALSERVNLSYVNDGWKLGANLSFGQPGKTNSSTVFGINNSQVLPDWFNYDLTATKTIGKWEVGLIGVGSADMSKAAWNSLADHLLAGAPYEKQSQFALGGLIGYNFPGITTQTYITRDVASSGYYNLSDGSKSYETRIWSRVIVPLWNPTSLESLKDSYK